MRADCDAEQDDSAEALGSTAAEDRLRESEARYRDLVENINEVVFTLDAGGIVTYISPVVTIHSGYAPAEIIGHLCSEFVYADDLAHVTHGYAQAMAGSTLPLEYRIVTKDGQPLWVNGSARPIMVDGRIIGMRGVLANVAARKKAEEALQERERLLSEAQRIARLGSWEVDVANDRLHYSSQMYHILGIAPDDFSHTTAGFLALLHPDDRPDMERWIADILAGKSPRQLCTRVVRPDGSVRTICGRGEAFFDEVGRPLRVVGTTQDITEQMHVEDALRDSEERYRKLLEMMPVGIAVHADGRIVFTNQAGARLLGAQHAGQIIGRPIVDIIHPDGLQQATERIQRMLAGEQGLYPVEDRYIRLDGSIAPVEVVAAPLTYDGKPAVQVVVTDISARKQAEARVNRQVERLKALHTIDAAITASFDMRRALDVVLKELLAQLSVDAAAILLLDEHMLTLSYVAGLGFHSTAIQSARLRLGEGFAGRAVLEQRTVHIANLQEGGGRLAQAMIMAGEGFVSYYAVPLAAKGRVRGVLEIFQRSTLQPDPDWLSFLELVAAEAAIAIDDAQIHHDLQRSNLDLSLAYDATIEGWSRALDLRDKETEGHTRRVTEMAVQLAPAMGVKDSDLIHIRRGALLHDIGKLGVPDAILLKTSALSDEEWQAMRKHPVFAYEMLAPIEYLRPALAIPYCHHERWDGLGYPRGLTGEEIPLAARLFAVVDVWDALRSDRSYRPAWTQEKALEHIREQAGKQFDPYVVDAFCTFVCGRAAPTLQRGE